MDFQHRPGAKTGSGGVASWSETNKDRRERLRQLALETIDLNKDPYFMKNHLGTYECKLCLTLHNNEGSYLAHTQGKKHQSNLARRAAKEARDASATQQMQPSLALAADRASSATKKKFVKIGRPGYKVTKQKDPENGQCSLLFQVDYPEIAEGIMPRHRFMSAYEQRVEPPDRRWQYLLFAAEPYETIAFKVPSREVDKPLGGFGFHDKKFWYVWNPQAKQFYLQFAFKLENMGMPSGLIPASSLMPPPKPPIILAPIPAAPEPTVDPKAPIDLAPPPPPPPGMMGALGLENGPAPGEGSTPSLGSLIGHPPPPPPGLPSVPPPL